MDELLQHLVNALILGSTYALLGIGLTLIFGIMRVVNFTHGELYALGAYAVFFLEVSLGVNFFLALVIAVIDYGLVFVNVEPFWQYIAVGTVIIISVLVDQTQRRFMGGRQVE